MPRSAGRSRPARRAGRRAVGEPRRLPPFRRDPAQASFDAEGTPKAPLPLIQDGVAHRVVHDVRSAALAGESSTGHALAPGGDPSGPHPTNLVLIGGGAAGEEELCAPVERGLYVTRLWYENVVRPKETLVTAVTRDGTFLIEDGRITRPVRDLRLTDSALSILSSVAGADGPATADERRRVLRPPLRRRRRLPGAEGRLGPVHRPGGVGAPRLRSSAG